MLCYNYEYIIWTLVVLKYYIIMIIQSIIIYIYIYIYTPTLNENLDTILNY